MGLGWDSHQVEKFFREPETFPPSTAAPFTAASTKRGNSLQGARDEASRPERMRSAVACAERVGAASRRAKSRRTCRCRVMGAD